MADTQQRGRGSGVFDHALMFISTGTVTRGTSVSSTLKIRGTPKDGLSVRMMIPRFPGTTCKFLPTVYASVDSSTFRSISVYPGGTLSATAGTGSATELQWEFAVPSSMPYVRLGFAYVGGTTGSNFGAVQAGIVPRGLGEWRRDVRWD